MEFAQLYRREKGMRLKLHHCIFQAHSKYKIKEIKK